MKTELDRFVASPEISIVEAMRRIDANACGILYLTNESGKLVGSLSDGDLRRQIIRTGSLDGQAEQAMHRNPVVLSEESPVPDSDFFLKRGITSVPVVDESGALLKIFFARQLREPKTKNDALEKIPVIIMAGGKGTRLYPYTKILPKPLIPIGDIPILERILNKFRGFGSKSFFLTVNYKKEMIKSYFADLDPDYQLTYVEENKPLGTAGSIRLIKEDFHTPVIVANCDSLIEADYGEIVRRHKESGNALTIVAALKNMTVPYGVLHTRENGVITEMEEKPSFSFFINTGMYVVEPDCLAMIPEDTFFHMPMLADALMKQGKQVGMYPVSEDSFLDMGEFEEMKRMEKKLGIGGVNSIEMRRELGG